MNYQRKTLPNQNWGFPAELPANVTALGLTDQQLQDMTASLGAEADDMGYGGQGFFLVVDDVIPVAPVSPYQFLQLFTPAERQTILGVAQTNMAIADWLNLLNHVDMVHLDDPKTILGVEALEGAGLIGSGRAAEILAGTPPA